MMVEEGGSIFPACLYISLLPLVYPGGDAARQVMFAEEMSPSGCGRFVAQVTAKAHCKC